MLRSTKTNEHSGTNSRNAHMVGKQNVLTKHHYWLDSNNYLKQIYRDQQPNLLTASKCIAPLILIYIWTVSRFLSRLITKHFFSLTTSKAKHVHIVMSSISKFNPTAPIFVSNSTMSSGASDSSTSSESYPASDISACTVSNSPSRLDPEAPAFTPRPRIHINLLIERLRWKHGLY
jgi:hypothetical protein